jgi:(2Fe-2S) ferredoxin
MSRYERHVFVCQNERPPDDPRGCCAAKGAAAVRDRLRAELKKRGLAPRVRTNNAGCLDACAYGTVLVIYPEGIWYGAVTPEDVEEIIDRTILLGEVVQRLLIPDRRYAPDRLQFFPLDPPAVE